MQIDPRSNLIKAAKYFHERGWMLGTAGNLSARLPDGSLWITASGKSKGELRETDFIRRYPDGRLDRLEPDAKPSAETAIHTAIYDRFPEAQACYHVHSIEANLVGQLAPDADHLSLPPLEMLKGLGIADEHPNVAIALFANHANVAQIGQDIADRLSTTPPQIPALLIRNHGVTVWGRSCEQARNRIELIEYIFRYMIAARQAGL
jgi:methylthioribulose-1-phosphate dehydratase